VNERISSLSIARMGKKKKGELKDLLYFEFAARRDGEKRREGGGGRVRRGAILSAKQRGEGGRKPMVIRLSYLYFLRRGGRGETEVPPWSRKTKKRRGETQKRSKPVPLNCLIHEFAVRASG